MVIAGLDPSYTGFGMCVGDGTCDSVVRLSSESRGKGIVNRMKRLDMLVGDVMRGLEEAKPDAIFIESYSFGSPFNREMMAELGCMVRWHVVDLTPFVFDVAPGTLKKFVTGKGSGSKDQMAAHVVKRWDRLFGNNDEVDAFAMYKLGVLCAGIEEPENEIQRKAIKTVLKDVNLKAELKERSVASAF